MTKSNVLAFEQKKDFFDEFLTPTAPGTRAVHGILEMVDRELIDPWPEQPRDHITPQQIAEKRDSIEAGFKAGKGLEGSGIEQPLTLRFHPDPEARQQGRYMIVDGELRWRGTSPADRGRLLPRQLPCLVRDLTEEEAWEVSAITGVQREEYSPVQTARIIQRTMQGMNKEQRTLTVREAALRFGKAKSWISDYLVLADPSPDAGDEEKEIVADLQEMTRKRPDTVAHARELKKISDRKQRRALIRVVIAENLSLAKLRERINPPEETMEEEETANSTSSPASGITPSGITTNHSTTGSSHSNGTAGSGRDGRGSDGSSRNNSQNPPAEDDDEQWRVEMDTQAIDPVRRHLQPSVAFLAEAARLCEESTPGYELRHRIEREIEHIERQLQRLKKALA